MLIKPDNTPGAKIIVVGVGGAGCNAINTMISMDIQNVQFVAMNTDKQALDASLSPIKIPLGQETTKGLGAGGNWEVGKAAAEEDIEIIHETLAGADMVFVTAGMGGGTGTGAAPVVSGIAKGLGALTVGVVYQPFLFEGRRRAENARHGLSEMKEKVDTLITIPNQKILETIDRKVSFIEAMKKGDDVLGQAIKSISDIITISGFINVDFADVKSVMKDAGSAVMGMGIASGDDRAVIATREAISSPLLDISIGGAQNALISITGNRELSMHEISDSMEIVQQYLSEDAHVIVGAAIDDKLDKDIKITVLATGFSEKYINDRTQVMNSMQQRSMPQIQTPPPVQTQQHEPVQQNHDQHNQNSQTYQSHDNENQNNQNSQNVQREENKQENTFINKPNFQKTSKPLPPQFPESNNKNGSDLSNDDDITNIPALFRRHGLGKK